MEALIKTLSHQKTGYGHFRVSVDFEGETISTTTTNTLAIDAAFDDCYDDVDNAGRYYESRKEAQESLVSEILAANEFDEIEL